MPLMLVPNSPNWWKVAVADGAPVLEFDAELERGLRGLDEIPLVDAKDLVIELQRGNGGFAHAHGCRSPRIRPA
jgi:hypothetical protein